MLIPRSHPWTRWQRSFIVGSAVVALAACAAIVYGYERYYRGPSESALFGIWQDTTPAMDSVTYYRFNPDGTFDELIDGMGHLDVMSRGKWYAGGTNIYVRLTGEATEGRRPIIFHIVDISPTEIRVRDSRMQKPEDATVWKRVVLPLPPQASNQTMERTADRCTLHI